MSFRCFSVSTTASSDISMVCVLLFAPNTFCARLTRRSSSLNDVNAFAIPYPFLSVYTGYQFCNTWSNKPMGIKPDRLLFESSPTRTRITTYCFKSSPLASSPAGSSQQRDFPASRPKHLRATKVKNRPRNLPSWGPADGAEDYRGFICHRNFIEMTRRCNDRTAEQLIGWRSTANGLRAEQPVPTWTSIV
jgi:hypothetical protein